MVPQPTLSAFNDDLPYPTCEVKVAKGERWHVHELKGPRQPEGEGTRTLRLLLAANRVELFEFSEKVVPIFFATDALCGLLVEALDRGCHQSGRGLRMRGTGVLRVSLPHLTTRVTHDVRSVQCGVCYTRDRHCCALRCVGCRRASSLGLSLGEVQLKAPLPRHPRWLLQMNCFFFRFVSFP